MSIESMMLAQHLNKIRAGRPDRLELPGEYYMECSSAEHVSKKIAIILVCVGIGLGRFGEFHD